MRQILVDWNFLKPSASSLQPLMEGPPDWRREPVGSRSNVKASCGFNSRSFLCGRIRCWFPETDCESVWRRFNSARSPLNHNSTSVLLGEQSASKTDTWGSNPHACAAAIAASADVARLRKAPVL